MCYVKCQNILVHLLEHLSYGLKCLSSLLSKFASHLKLIQSVVRVGILGSVTNSILQVLFSGLWVSGSQVPSSKFQGPSSRVPCPRVAGLRVSRSQVQGFRVLDPGSQVLILDYALQIFFPRNLLFRQVLGTSVFPHAFS